MTADDAAVERVRRRTTGKDQKDNMMMAYYDLGADDTAKVREHSY